jgi:hypothetical protein
MCPNVFWAMPTSVASVVHWLIGINSLQKLVVVVGKTTSSHSTDKLSDHNVSLF